MQKGAFDDVMLALVAQLDVHLTAIVIMRLLVQPRQIGNILV